MRKIERWDYIELTFRGHAEGNPFTDYEITASFTGPSGTLTVDGFYDGDGIYKVRFMPENEGMYTYRVTGSFMNGETAAGPDPLEGAFEAAPASADNHGPVRVTEKVHLRYADGTPYYSIGTTAYAWVCQTMELQEQTLDTLAHTCFNKIRFSFLPKHYLYNFNEPITYPFVRGKRRGQDPERLARAMKIDYGGDYARDITDFDCYTPNVEHFRRFDLRIGQLRDLGIEADLIFFYDYDRWGFANMKDECDRLYLKYCVARYSAFRNVWWSMANEYDIMTKTDEEWESLGELVSAKDPYRHMLSIHNCLRFYDYTRPWITHCSMQRIDLYKHVEETDLHLKKYEKPVVWDEIAYEGNIDMGWGNISGQELTRRFWEAFLRGGHAGHGDTFMDPDDVLWWAKGGVLKGESEPRLAFLLKILKDMPCEYLKAGEGIFDETVGIPSTEERHQVYGTTPVPGSSCSFEIHYFGFGRPSFRTMFFPEGERFHVEVIDTWNMTIEDRGIMSGVSRIDLPSREYMAIRLTKVN